MDQKLPSANTVNDAWEAAVPRRADERPQCSICARRLGKTLAYLEETGDVPEPRQSWLLCEACSAAVHLQMERSQVRTPLRLRVAVALVSTERTPGARRARRGQLSDTAWIKLLFWAFILALLAHLAVIVLIAGIAR
ncbi:MAG: hypothetical protein IVW57_17305 [Ktedonobacterales bacterium]|nr:hypothetical protein [Ktedonobacterales bacterium]